MRAEPEPAGPRALHRTRRLLEGRRRLAIVTLLAVGGAALLIVAIGGGSRMAPRTQLAPGLGTARARLVRSGARAELRLADMPQPPIGEIYEVWLTRPGSRPKPTNALFTPTSAGTAAVEVPGGLQGVRLITVTAEPVGGSSGPTSPVILRVALDGSSA